MSTLTRTSGYQYYVAGSAGYPGYWKRVPVGYEATGAVCVARRRSASVARYVPAGLAGRDLPAGAQPVYRSAGYSDSLGNPVSEIVGFTYSEQVTETTYSCAQSYAAHYADVWIPPVPATPGYLRASSAVGWTAGAESIGALAANGALSFKVPASASGVFCGLSTRSDSAGNSEIRYAIHAANGKAQAYLSGVAFGQQVSYSDSSVLAISRNAGHITFSAGGYAFATVREALDTIGLPLIADCSLYAGGDSIVDPSFSTSPLTYSSVAADTISAADCLTETVSVLSSDYDDYLSALDDTLSVYSSDYSDFCEIIDELLALASDHEGVCVADIGQDQVVSFEEPIAADFTYCAAWLESDTIYCEASDIEIMPAQEILLPQDEVFALSTGSDSNDIAVCEADLPECEVFAFGSDVTVGLVGGGALSAFSSLHPTPEEAAQQSADATEEFLSDALALVNDEYLRLLAAIDAFSKTDRYNKRQLTYALQTDCRDELARVAESNGWAVSVSQHPPVFIEFGLIVVSWK